MGHVDYNYQWKNTAGADSTTQYDGTKQYDGTAGGQVFWEDILGPSLLWIEPKTDWTSQDYYNFSDLNRVEIDTKYIAAVLSDFRAVPINLDTVTNRDTKRFEYYDSMNRVEGNEQILADNFFQPVGWETPKTNWRSGGRFDYRDANRLEKNLLLLCDLVLKAIDNLKYCGTFSAGEEGEIY